MPLPHSLRALASPNFRRYYIGQAVSMIGTWVQSVAMMWLAYRLSNSTYFTGLIGFLQSAPHLVLGPFAGVLGDRVSRRKMLIAVLSLMGVQAAILAVLSATNARDGASPTCPARQCVRSPEGFSFRSATAESDRSWSPDRAFPMRNWLS